MAVLALLAEVIQYLAVLPPTAVVKAVITVTRDQMVDQVAAVLVDTLLRLVAELGHKAEMAVADMPLIIQREAVAVAQVPAAIVQGQTA